MQPTRRTPAATDDPRGTAFSAWIDACLAGRNESRVAAQALPAAASFRRFTRVRSTRGCYVAIDAPPERENNPQYVRLAAHLRAHGIAVPEVFAADLERGFLLVSDFGDRRFGDVYGTPEEDAALEAALSTLVRLQRLPPTDLVPPYTRERLEDEFGLFASWLCEGLLGVDPDAGLLVETRTQLVDAMTAQPKLCVHRDYHSQNLMWRPGGKIGVLDFQDALWGPLCYDLASLLGDCYHRFPDADVARWRARYLALARPAGIDVPVDDETFARWLEWTGLQRQIKAVGIFARLQLRDGRDRHLDDIPPVLDRIVASAARYPALAPFAEWVDARVRPAAAARLGRGGDAR